MNQKNKMPFVAIACGGTGGHLFPGIAVGEELLRRDCDVALLISPKDVDQQAVKSAHGMQVMTLPAVGLSGNFFKFARGFWKSYREAKNFFAKRQPDAVLAMGGFTSAAPTLAGKHLGAKTFLHESNSIPGRANRWLAHVVDQAFVYFHQASGMLAMQEIDTVGMPVRSQFLDEVDAGAARMSLGLDANKPTLLVMGGSQGASGINDLLIRTIPLITERLPDFQFLHLTGPNDVEKVQAAYAAAKRKAIARPFLSEMELALGAATVAISRSGASSLAELAAMRVPAILIPYPHAADDHQYYNALGFVEAGAARMIDQSDATPETLVNQILELATNQKIRSEVQSALAKWHTPNAAEKIAEKILAALAPKLVAAEAGKRLEEPNPRQGGYDIRKEANA
jgi:UDP-N-acetylglucosamine--N-acetylmuramyl-(pentapeptide) pyrophosphoryl-undecaprenol N-acetylglucosamine transferase